MPKSEFATFDEALEAYGVVLSWPGEEAAEKAAAARAALAHAWAVRERARTRRAEMRKKREQRGEDYMTAYRTAEWLALGEVLGEEGE